MYTKKFEADSLDDALKSIKSELGPEAIILKTITNKGLKGAFKKKKIEITAAIPEKELVKKMKVDKVLDNEDKHNFYSAPASHVANMIDRFDKPSSAQGYGSLGLNKKVKKRTDSVSVDNLDDFLSQAKTQLKPELESPPVQEHYQAPPAAVTSKPQFDELEEYQKKVDEMERNLFELTKKVHQFGERQPEGLVFIRSLLKSIELDDSTIHDIFRKAISEMTESELQSQDLVFEFAITELAKLVQTSNPIFEQADRGILVLMSDGSCGQSTSFMKLAKSYSNCILLQYGKSDLDNFDFAQKVLGIEVFQVDSLSDLIAECRKGYDSNKKIIIDFRNSNHLEDETKKFVDTLKRSFEQVEIILTLSAIHSEIYNKKVFRKYHGSIDGINFTYIDHCLNYGPIFNVHQLDTSKPLMFFGTGRTIPDDIEAASVERLVGGMFKLENE